MATDFPGIPEDIYEYNNVFDYSLWTPNTTITCTSVPWDATYRDIVRFDTNADKDAYFNRVMNAGYTFTLTGMVYLRFGEPIRVNAPFSMINQYNYVIVRNPTQPVPGANTPEVFYYFINDATYIAPNCTQLNVQLDVWQTYYDRLTFGMCYINKGHVGIANKNSTVYNLRDYLTDTEGLNIGDEYEIVNQTFYNFQEESPYIVIVSNTDLEADFGSVSNPNLATAKGDVNDGMPTGARCYALTAEHFMEFMRAISKYPWVSQGIIMLTVVPRVFCQLSPSSTTIAGVEAYMLSPNPDTDGGEFITDEYFERFAFPERYKELFKFYTYPYSFVEMTGLNGGELVLKNECQTVDKTYKVSSGKTYKEVVHYHIRSVCAPPTIRGSVIPLGYNSVGDNYKQNDLPIKYYSPDGKQYTNTIGGGEYLDVALLYDNFPQLSILNNMYLYYMASNVHSLSYQFQTADWSQQKALTGANLAYRQSTNAMDTALANQNVANQAAWVSNDIALDKNSWSGIAGAIGGGTAALTSLGSGNAPGALAGALGALGSGVNSVVNMNFINRATSNSVSAATQTTANNIANQAYMRDTNYDYARFAAKGDYENAIAGIQAKVQDAKLLQPSTSGQNGGDPFNMCQGFNGFLIKWKRLKKNFIVQVGDFWLRYGYYINRWMRPPQNLKCMSNFTYWKMQQVQLNGMMPEVFKEAIRGVFEKGVTVWSDPDKINNIDLADNAIEEGIAY